MDAIVPASDQDEDSTEEDEEYKSYIHEQEHQHQQLQQQKKLLALQIHQAQYDSADEAEEHDGDGDEDDDGESYASYQQRQQQQPHHHQHQQLQQIQLQYQLQQQQHLHAYKSQAMNIQQLLRQGQNQDHDMNGTDSHEEEEYYQQNPQHDPNRQLQMDIDMHQSDEDDEDDFDDDVDEDEEDQVDEEMMDEDEEDDSETMSLTEEDIDFNLVYAFHTFVATQEGQASVVRNDSLMLLEDTNVYWWLVRVLKTGVIGYIPAENIETPFERLARLNTYRNVSLSAPSPEWGTFDEHIQPLDPAILEQRAQNRRSVIFTAQNEYLEASETEWTSEEEEEDGDWYEDEDEDEGDEEDEEDDDEEEESDEQLLDLDDTQEEDSIEADHAGDDNHNGNRTEKSALQLEAERVQQEILNDQRRQDTINANAKTDLDKKRQKSIHENAEDDGEAQVTNRYRKPLLDEDDIFANAEPRVISLTPAIARDDAISRRAQTPPGKATNLRLSDDTTRQQQQQPQNKSTASKPLVSPTTGLRSPTLDSEEEDKENMKMKMAERKEAKLSAILGSGRSTEHLVRKSKEEYEQGLQPETVVVKKPGKFKSLFGVGKSSKDKERKEKERLEKERLKSLAKSSSGSSSGIGNSIFRTRSNSSGSMGSGAQSITSSAASQSSTPSAGNKSDTPQREIMTLRVYPGNVDFGASMYKTVVVTPTTMASEIAHQAVVKFRLAPDGTASTGDFYLTVKGVDGDETVLQATDKPMAIYQSLTAHLTTPLPANHRLSISSVSSMMSVNSSGSQSSYSNNLSTSTATSSQPTLRRSSSGRSDPQQRSIRFLLNKKIRRASSLLVSSLPSTPTTPTAPQEDFFWVKVVCQAQDLPQSMLLLEGMGTAMDKSDPRAHNQMVATKVEHWIPMHATSNAGDVIFRTLDKIGIRSGVVDGVPESVLATKRATVPHGLVIEYQLGLKLNSSNAPKRNSGNKHERDDIPLAPQVSLSRCFEEYHLVPVRRSPKADVASMPTNPDHVFFIRKATKSLQAEMRFVQEQLERQQRRSVTRERNVPSPLLQSQTLRSTDSETNSVSSAQPSPTTTTTNMATATAAGDVLSPSTSPSPQGRVSNTDVVSGTAMNNGNSSRGVAASPPIRVPRRTDSVIMNPAGPSVRGNSFDNTSAGRPSPTLSAQSLMTTQQIHPPQQISRTPTPDRSMYQQPQSGRARSPSVTASQGSSPVTGLARPLQASSPAPSNLSNSADQQQQEGSRSSTPERPSRFERPERQRAISPALTHGPSPLSMSAVMFHQSDSNGRGDVSPVSTHPVRLNMKRNVAHGVDIVLNKGIVRSSRSDSSSLSQGQYRYSFVPLGGGAEEIDITEIIEDVLGGDQSDDEQQDDGQQQYSRRRALSGGEGDRDLESMSRKERVAAALARASQAVAAGKERRKANASSGSVASTSSFSSRKKSHLETDWLERLGTSSRGVETLLKLERALAAGEVTTSSPTSGVTNDESGDGSVDGESLVANATMTRNTHGFGHQHHLNNRSLPSPLSLASGISSSSTSPTHRRNISDAEVRVASVSHARSHSSVVAAMGRESVDGGGLRSNSPGQQPSSPSSTSVYAKPTLLPSIASVPGHRGSTVASHGSSPASVTSLMNQQQQQQQQQMEARSFSPLPRPLQTPSPAVTGPHQLSIQTKGMMTIGGGASSPAGSSSASTIESISRTPSGLHRHGSSPSRSRSASASAVAEISRAGSSASSSPREVGHGASTLESSSSSAATTTSSSQNEAWLLASDYNKGMQDLLTLVRGGRSSSVGTSAPSTFRNGSGLMFGKDGRILQQQTATDYPVRQRQLSLQHTPSSQFATSVSTSASSSTSSLYNSKSNNIKDTHAHDNHVNSSSMNNDHHHSNNKYQRQHHAMNSNFNTINESLEGEQEDIQGNQGENQPDSSSSASVENGFVPRIWTRMDRRLRDVQEDCHPEVFECWRGIDADLDRVERELDTLLATVKATVF
ncbi:hypothetical protein BGX28_008495 [Mortierella sp. GBA30]|nr:hypothetical protein BGX28_008495 [Mortierella sp. GBA30]